MRNVVKIEIPNLTLSYLVLELKPFVENAFVNKVQELENGWLKIKLHSSAGSKDLIVSPNAIFFTNYSIPAKQETTGFGAFLRKQLYNKKIVSMKQHGFDRVIVLEFLEHFLIFELFAKGNIILTDKEFKTLAVLRKETWKDRELKRGVEYNFPASKGKSPDKISIEELNELLSRENNVVLSLINGMNISPTIAEEICYVLKISKDFAANKLSNTQIEEIFSLLREFYSISSKQLNPCVIETEASNIILPFELTSIKSARKAFSLNDLLDELLSKSALEKPEEQVKWISGQKRKAEQLTHTITEQKNAIEELEKEVFSNKYKGEQIFAHYVELKNLLSAIDRGLKNGLDEKEIFSQIKKVYPKLKFLSIHEAKLIIELPD